MQALDLMPVISYLLLKGRCRYCNTRYSFRYLFVEVLTGLVFVWCLTAAPTTQYLLGMLVFAAFMLLITFIDIDHHLILDKVLACLAADGLVFQLVFRTGGLTETLAAVFGSELLGGFIMLLIIFASRGEGMGGGDMKFAVALGFWLNWQLLLLTLLLAFILGGIAGAVLLLLGLKGRKDGIPFGPYISLAAMLSMLYGSKIIEWYLTRVL